MDTFGSRDLLFDFIPQFKYSFLLPSICYIRNNRLCRLWKCSTGSITIIIRCVFRNGLNIDAVYVVECSMNVVILTMQHYRSEKPYGSDNVACSEYVNSESIWRAHRNVVVWSMNVLNILGSIWFDPCFAAM